MSSGCHSANIIITTVGNFMVAMVTICGVNSLNINIDDACRPARNALCFEESQFAVTVQLNNIKAETIRFKLYR